MATINTNNVHYDDFIDAPFLPTTTLNDGDETVGIFFACEPPRREVVNALMDDEEFEIRNYINPIAPPEEINMEHEYRTFEVEEISAHRTVWFNKKYARVEFLVKWVGYNRWYNTWEPEANLTDCDELFVNYLISPAFHLWDARPAIEY
jgi:hypothetical protein